MTLATSLFAFDGMCLELLRISSLSQHHMPYLRERNALGQSRP